MNYVRDVLMYYVWLWLFVVWGKTQAGLKVLSQFSLKIVHCTTVHASFLFDIFMIIAITLKSTVYKLNIIFVEKVWHFTHLITYEHW